MSKRYQSDLTDNQWAIIKALIPAEKEGGRPRATDMREVMNAIFYLLRTGCQWDYLPKWGSLWEGTKFPMAPLKPFASLGCSQ